ncbi:hypothetical protein GOP47_0000361 [Adiantum capillus-veneris]|uniref:Transcription termination factor MTERF9, chloroplastic n=1 Tax=Adiantum capillus-veneris TaxID=13818 RepID=A0A9D4VF04_ADICA|nr:hypothetical protein GOP47_0000361 [Adiantum capillus-veneris]
MLAFARPLYGVPRLLSHGAHLHRHPDSHLFTFDSDDDEDADELILLDELEDFADVKKSHPSKLPLLLPTTEKKLSSGGTLKKTLKLVASVPATLEPSKTKILDAKEWGGSLHSINSRSVRNNGRNHLSGLSESTWEEKAYEFIRKKKLKESLADTQQITRAPERMKAVVPPPEFIKAQIPQKDLVAGLELEEKCQPVVEYLLSLGLDESTLQRIGRRRKACFNVKINKVKERLGYLMSLGIKNEDIGKVITRHPQVLEYTVDRMMKPRVQYLQSIGVPEARLGRVLTVSPSLLRCSLAGTLKKRVRFLVEEVGVTEGDVPKIVLLSPQILTQSITDSLRPRINFLLKKVGLSQERVAKMITKHPQLLHYSIRNGIQPRLDFLSSIGLSDHDISVVLGRSSQVLSLSVEKSLKPKCDYLTKELKCGLQTIVSFPAYLSLSLEQRIRPRHEFLKLLGKLPSGPFPMCALAVTDQEYCERWAKSTVEEYYSFRQSLRLSHFAKQFAKKNRVLLEGRSADSAMCIAVHNDLCKVNVQSSCTSIICIHSLSSLFSRGRVGGVSHITLRINKGRENCVISFNSGEDGLHSKNVIKKSCKCTEEELVDAED